MTELDDEQSYAVRYLRERAARARRQLDRTISVAERLHGPHPHPRDEFLVVELLRDNISFLVVAADHVRKACEFARKQGLDAPQMVTSTAVKALRDLEEHWDLWRPTSDGQVWSWLKISAGKRWKQADGNPFPLDHTVFSNPTELVSAGGLSVQDFRSDLDAIDDFLETLGDG